MRVDLEHFKTLSNFIRPFISSTFAKFLELQNRFSNFASG